MEKIKDSSISIDLSKRIHSLRFLLIFFIIIIHVHSAITDVIATIPSFVLDIQNFVSVITAVAVPLSFLISAFLLYIKEKEYIETIKTKIITILLPYILWTLLFLLFYFIVQNTPVIKEYFNNDPNAQLKNYKIIDWIQAFVGKYNETRKNHPPFIGQFWFLRDLFILNLVFPLIKKGHR